MFLNGRRFDCNNNEAELIYSFIFRFSDWICCEWNNTKLLVSFVCENLKDLKKNYIHE